MEMKELKFKLRNDYAMRIRPYYIKEKCEICGSSEELELHHEVNFITLLDKAIADLCIDVENITDSELELLKTYMLGLQIQNENVTLCSKCHYEFHSINEGFRSKHKKISEKTFKQVSKIEDDSTVVSIVKTLKRKAPEGKKETNAQRLIKSLLSLEAGRVVKMKDIIEESGLSRDKIKECKKYSACKIWFEQHKGNKKGEYIA